MQWLVVYLQYFGLFLASILLFYSIGRITVFATRKIGSFSCRSSYEAIFLYSFIGLIASVTIFSLFITSLKTVHILFLFVALFTILRLERTGTKARNSFSLRLTGRQAAELFLYALLVFSVFALGVIRREDWTSFTNVPHLADWTFYSTNMQTLLATGQENFYNVNNLLDRDYRGMAPYHYFEMWVAGIWKSILPQLLPIYLFSLVAYPVCAFLALIGTWTFLDYSLQLSWRYKLLSFLCFFCSGWFFLDARFLMVEESLGILTSSINYHFLFLLPKRLIAYLSLLFSLVLWNRRQNVSALLGLLLIPVVSVDSLPAIFGGVLLLGIVNFKREWISHREFYFVWVVYPLFGVLFLSLYRLFGNHKIPFVDAALLLTESFQQSTGAWVLPFLFFGRAVLLVLVLYSFHLWITYMLAQKEDNEQWNRFVLLTGLMVLSGCVGWALFYLSPEGIQFLTGILAICQTVVLTGGLILLSRRRNLLSKALICIYVLASFSYTMYTYFLAGAGEVSLPYASTYLTAVRQTHPRSKIGISIRARDDFELWANRNVVTHSLGDDYLAFMPQYLKAVEVGVLNVPDTPFRARPSKIPFLNIPLHPERMDAYRSRLLQQAGLFYRFYQRLQKQRPGITEDEAQVAFLDSYRIDWGIVSKRAVIGPRLRQRIVGQEVDPVSGERFLLLKLEGSR